MTCVIASFICYGEGFKISFGGSADLRTDDTKLVRIARKLSKLEPKVLLRNFPSVEQIQDSGSELRLESFAKVEDLKHNSELPLNASDQDKSRLRQFYNNVGFHPTYGLK